MIKKIMSVILAFTITLSLLPVLSTTVDAAAYDSAEVIAVAQKYADKGSSRWKGLCLAFVAYCFNEAYGVYSTTCCAYRYGTSFIDNTSDEDIPLGADVFFAGSKEVCDYCGSNCGHVGIYAGDGNIIHSWGGKVCVSSIDFVVGCGYKYRGYGWHGDAPLADGYFAKCDTYSVNCRIEANSSTQAMSLPCDADVEGSTVVTEVSEGDSFTADSLILNDQGDYWYRVEDDGERAYISAETVDYVEEDCTDITISNVSAPSALTKGKTYIIKGDIASTSHELLSVSAYVYAGTDTSGEPVTGGSDSVSGNHYELRKSNIDNKTKFGSLAVGTYTYSVAAEYVQTHVEDGKMVKSTGTATLFQCTFVVVKSGTSTCTVTLDANGGICATERTTLAKNTEIGELSTAQREGYEFAGWYTAAAGGSEITQDTVFSSDATVYAQWTAPCRTVTYYDMFGEIWMTEEIEPEEAYTVSSEYPKAGGYYFCGWAHSPESDVYEIRPTSEMAAEQDVLLYPVYVSHEQAVSGEPVCIYNIADFTAEGYDISEVFTDNVVAYVITESAPENVFDAAVESVMGDVNGDGWVDSDDAALVLLYDVGLIDDGLNLSVGDVNSDGRVDSDDATLILMFDVCLIEEFSAKN